MAIPLIPPLTDFQRDILMWARKTLEDDPRFQSGPHYFELSSEDLVTHRTEMEDLLRRGMIETHQHPIYGNETGSRRGFRVMSYGWELAGVLLGRVQGGMI